MTLKVQTGVTFFDEKHGGVFDGRCWILCGPSGTGKSAVALQFMARGIAQGERCLLLSVQRAVDAVLWASAHSLGMGKAIESGQFGVLEYGDIVPGRDQEQDPSLPPEGFLDLQRIVNANSIQRVVLDTVLPWTMTYNPESLGERVFSLVRAFERMKCTTLLTLPRPISPNAVRLKQALESVVPVAVELSLSLENGQRTWLTTKYLGDVATEPPIAYSIIPGKGAQAGTESRSKPAPIERSPDRARFSAAVFGHENHSNRAPDRTARFGMTIMR